ncbi:hypothetical protein [Hymenobacter sp. IS2118]|uniref:hypothetical protein n=1 Tax=Hymenobacter sp. IS2118 TaxID=1505605 RepID=UPI000AEBC8BA|nr:hypothetical protein [Hymenobacter sp. IS2118]
MTSSFIPNPLPANGFPVAVNEIRAGFTLFGFLPFGHSYNSMSPRLVLHNNKLEVKILRTDYYEYKSISQADYLPERFFASSQLLLELPTHNVSFYLKLTTPAAEKELLQFLRAQGVALSGKALQVAGL